MVLKLERGRAAFAPFPTCKYLTLMAESMVSDSGRILHRKEKVGVCFTGAHGVSVRSVSSWLIVLDLTAVGSVGRSKLSVLHGPRAEFERHSCHRVRPRVHKRAKTSHYFQNSFHLHH